ncbi:hypothetical protein ACFSSC_03185 [Corynebacterium mendelii]|uniref:Tetratricopeptide repeat protein n=1 Tax=Corynebacterium mendelii TaxID=2765362 RepID=A0A939E0P9_9CORY|nr:hypothetical protein [Corynebacterium mendelii]MBN9643591.1 hypothetical protein [Corynebacterium mendelii]
MGDSRYERNDNDRRRSSRGASDRDHGRPSRDRGRDDRRDGERRNDRRDGERRYGERDDRRGGGRRHNDRDERRSGERRGGRGNDRRGGGGQRENSQHHRSSGPHRPGFAEQRRESKRNEPSIPEDVTAKDLDSTVLQDLRSLTRDNAEQVGRHMVMAAQLMGENPQRALEHARAAKNRAGRVAVVRETCGIAAYHAGEWKEAVSELRAARRMSGGPGLLAVIADCERGLGRPHKAIEIARSEEAADLDGDQRIELAIVAAGARRDMDDPDGAVAELALANPDPDKDSFANTRLLYAYADALAASGRTAEAVEWFGYADTADTEELYDSADRIRQLTANQ